MAHSRSRRGWFGDFSELADATTKKWAENVNSGPITGALIALTVLYGAGLMVATLLVKPGEQLAPWGIVCRGLTIYVGLLAGAWLVISGLVALVQAWGEQSHRLRLAESRLTDERDRKLPRLVARIERLTVQSDAKRIAANPYILATVSVSNEGRESAAGDWEMWITLNNKDTQVPEWSLGETAYVKEVRGIDSASSNARKSATYDFENLLTTATATPIKRGDRRTGFFLGRLLRVASVSLDDLRTVRVRYLDFKNTVHEVGLRDVAPEMGLVEVEPKRYGLSPPMGFRNAPIKPPS
jgi:hypothetical protein